MSLQANVKNGLLSGGTLSPSVSNIPTQYADRKHRYFDDESSRNVAEKAKYSSDFFEAQAQGLYSDEADRWTTVLMRMSDVVRPSAAIQRNFDDYKQILIARPTIDYVKKGTKFECMGSTWLSVNPANISASDGTGIVQRCNAVWNFYDYYGNVVSEPIIVENIRANASDSDSQESGLITKGYFQCKAQYNENTKQLDTNSRMILGTAAYRVTGYSDFQTEFTGDYSTVRLLEFTLRFEEPNAAIDDMENHVAGGKVFSWNIEINGNDTSEIKTSGTMQFTAVSKRNGETVYDTLSHPIRYRWSSSNPSVASVDDTGLVTGVSEGEAVITATLAENPLKSVSIALSVVENDTAPHIEFVGSVPKHIEAYDNAVVTAAYFENGAETAESIDFELSCADEGSYTALHGARAVEISCWHGSVSPLVVTAKRGNFSETVEISLVGI